MQRYEVEAIFEARKEAFFRGKSASENPIAIILGGQPACGKSTLIRVAEADHPLQNFLLQLMVTFTDLSTLIKS